LIRAIIEASQGAERLQNEMLQNAATEDIAEAALAYARACGWAPAAEAYTKLSEAIDAEGQGRGGTLRLSPAQSEALVAALADDGSPPAALVDLLRPRKP
jgi:hypothetical protein